MPLTLRLTAPVRSREGGGIQYLVMRSGAGIAVIACALALFLYAAPAPGAVNAIFNDDYETCGGGGAVARVFPEPSDEVTEGESR